MPNLGTPPPPRPARPPSPFTLRPRPLQPSSARLRLCLGPHPHRAHPVTCRALCAGFRPRPHAPPSPARAPLASTRAHVARVHNAASASKQTRPRGPGLARDTTGGEPHAGAGPGARTPPTLGLCARPRPKRRNVAAGRGSLQNKRTRGSPARRAAPRLWARRGSDINYACVWNAWFAGMHGAPAAALVARRAPLRYGAIERPPPRPRPPLVAARGAAGARGGGAARCGRKQHLTAGGRVEQGAARGHPS